MHSVLYIMFCLELAMDGKNVPASTK